MKPLVLLLLLISQNSSAQKPFRFKLIAFFEDISDFSMRTDTLYFGCDSLGAEGYQEGLDIIDTVIKPNSWYFIDTIIKNQFNLSTSINSNQNIKRFKFNQGVGWQTYFNSSLVAIKCDTNELVYQESRKAFLSLMISCNGCSIGLWHKDYGSFGMNRWDNGTPYFYNDSLNILEAGNTMQISLFLTDSLTLGINEKMPSIQFINENPITERLTIKFNKCAIGLLFLTDVSGQELLNIPVDYTAGEKLNLNTGQLKPGLYYLTFIPRDANNLKSTLKVLKK